MPSIAEKVIEYLRTNPNARPLEIANYLGLNIRLVRAVLTQLRQRGIVVKTDRGYSLRPGALAGVEERPQKSMGSDNSLFITTVDTGPKNLESGRNTVELGVHRQEIDDIKSRLIEIDTRVSNIEDKIRVLEKELNDVRSKVLNSSQTQIVHGDVDMLDAITDILDIVKMCLQAIAVGDMRMLGSLIGDLDDGIDRLKHKLSHRMNKR
uniref:Uncharacterized protein n=1 Tax=Ignisphaera aggregans TaxID=334771 RepID=A0A7C2VM39_9CREN